MATATQEQEQQPTVEIPTRGGRSPWTMNLLKVLVIAAAIATLAIGVIQQRVILGSVLGAALFLLIFPFRNTPFSALKLAQLHAASLPLMLWPKVYYDHAPEVLPGQDIHGKKVKPPRVDDVGCNWIRVPGEQGGEAFLAEQTSESAGSHSFTVLHSGWKRGVHGDPEQVAGMRLAYAYGMMMLASTWPDNFGWTDHYHRIPANKKRASEQVEDRDGGGAAAGPRQNARNAAALDLGLDSWAGTTVTGPRPKHLRQHGASNLTLRQGAELEVVQGAYQVEKLMSDLLFGNARQARPTEFMAYMRAMYDPVNARAAYNLQHQDVIMGAEGHFLEPEDTLLGRERHGGPYPPGWVPQYRCLRIGDTWHRFYEVNYPRNTLTAPGSQIVEYNRFDGLQSGPIDLYYGFATNSSVGTTRSARAGTTLTRHLADLIDVFRARAGNSQSVASQWRRIRNEEREEELLQAGGLTISQSSFAHLSVADPRQLDTDEERLQNHFARRGNLKLNLYTPLSIQKRMAHAIVGVPSFV